MTRRRWPEDKNCSLRVPRVMGRKRGGLPNLGKDLVASEFVHSISDDELHAFIITGRPMWDPANTIGIDMPPKGGNPALTDEDIRALIAYLRSLSA